MRSKWADRILLVGVASAIFGAVVAFALYMARAPEWVEQLVAANPSWDIGRSANGWLAVTEKATGARLRVPEIEAGPYRMTRVPCAEMEKAAPPWFRTPPDTTATPALACVRLDAPGHDVYITNFRTTLEVPEIWEDFYEPLTRDYHYDGSGGGTISSASAIDSRRFGNVVSYNVSSRQSGDSRDTLLAAFYVEGKATVVVTFRDIKR